MSVEDIAKEIVSSQGFEFDNFQQAKKTMSVYLAGKECILVYDRYTTDFYKSDLPFNEQQLLKKMICDKLHKKLNNDGKKLLYEYHTLLRFCKCNRIHFVKITKEIRPDFVVITDKQENVGIEVTELTTEIDKKRLSTQKKLESISADGRENTIKCIFNNDKIKFKNFSIGSSRVLFPNQSTCLFAERDVYINQLKEKYDMYFAPLKEIEYTKVRNFTQTVWKSHWNSATM